MADKQSALLSGALLARKGAASADGFTLADAALARTSIQSSYRWRLAIISVAIAISCSVIAFVGAALVYGDRWAPSVPPARTAENLLAAPSAGPAPKGITEDPAAHSPAKIEPSAGPTLQLLAAAPPRTAPKPLAVAVANDLSKQNADKIVAAAAEPPAADRKPVPEPAVADDTKKPEKLLANIDAGVRPTVAPPPRPKNRPRRVARPAYRVQLHALASDAAVRREWRRLRKRHRALFSGLKLKVSPKRTGAGRKTVFRMQLGALSSRTQANALCKKLQRRKMSCIVVR